MSRRKIYFAFLVLVFISFIYSARPVMAIDIPDDEKWVDNPDNSILINQDTTWSGDMTFHDPARPIRVVDGATLTIEAGTHVRLANTLIVNLGRVVAIGTEDNNIIFDITSDADMGLDPNRDKTCEEPMQRAIEFNDHSRLYGLQASTMKYVKFENLGVNFFYPSAEELAGCQYASLDNFFRNIFGINFVSADDVTPDVALAALHFIDGALYIDKSSFTGNYYTDIKVDAEFNRDWDQAPPYLEVSDTNLENNHQDFALISSVQGRDSDSSEYQPDKTRVQLINDWFGDASGPNEIDILGSAGKGEKITGQYTLVSFRTSKYSTTTSDTDSSDSDDDDDSSNSHHSKHKSHKKSSKKSIIATAPMAFYFKKSTQTNNNDAENVGMQNNITTVDNGNSNAQANNIGNDGQKENKDDSLWWLWLLILLLIIAVIGWRSKIFERLWQYVKNKIA